MTAAMPYPPPDDVELAYPAPHLVSSDVPNDAPFTLFLLERRRDNINVTRADQGVVAISTSDGIGFVKDPEAPRDCSTDSTLTFYWSSRHYGDGGGYGLELRVTPSEASGIAAALIHAADDVEFRP
jgi:hypothetical protein